jgi:hypothetical protein
MDPKRAASKAMKMSTVLMAPAMAAAITQFSTSGSAFASHCASWWVRGSATASSKSICLYEVSEDLKLKCSGDCCQYLEADVNCFMGDYVCMCGQSARPFEGHGETCPGDPICPPGGGY